MGSIFLDTASKDRKIRLASTLLLSAEIASKVLNGVGDWDLWVSESGSVGNTGFLISESRFKNFLTVSQEATFSRYDGDTE